MNQNHVLCEITLTLCAKCAHDKINQAKIKTA